MRWWMVGLMGCVSDVDRMALRDAAPPSSVIIEDHPVNVSIQVGCGAPFCDVGALAGLHAVGPMNGRGAASIDVDGDGWEDLWQSNDLRSDLARGTAASTLWRNMGDGTFEVLDLGIPAEKLQHTWGGIWGDVDNDGDPDLFVANGGYAGQERSYLFRNDLDVTNRFTDVTELAGLNLESHAWWGASFADYNRDGWLDLVVSARHDVVVGQPILDGPTLLYRNRGDGSFANVTGAVGLSTIAGDHKNPVWVDLNGDGWPDLFLASLVAPRMFLNLGGRRFREMPGVGQMAPVFSAAAGDFNQDGIDDLYLGRMDRQEAIVLGDRQALSLLGRREGLRTTSHENTMGLLVGDLTTDGWPEVVIGTGVPAIRKLPVILCMQEGQLPFERCSDDGIIGPLQLAHHHGAALLDYDHDGDNDMFYSLGGFSLYDVQTGSDSRDLAALYNRETPLVGATATIRLVGTTSNRSAVGARMTVTGSRTHHYTVRSGEGFMSQNSEWTVVQLGDEDEADVTVQWPSGARTYTTVPAGSRVLITE